MWDLQRGDLDKDAEVVRKSNRLGKLGENRSKGISHSGSQRSASSKSGKCDGPHLRGRECVGEYTKLVLGRYRSSGEW